MNVDLILSKLGWEYPEITVQELKSRLTWDYDEHYLATQISMKYTRKQPAALLCSTIIRLCETPEKENKTYNPNNKGIYSDGKIYSVANLELLKKGTEYKIEHWFQIPMVAVNTLQLSIHIKELPGLLEEGYEDVYEIAVCRLLVLAHAEDHTIKLSEFDPGTFFKINNCPVIRVEKLKYINPQVFYGDCFVK